MGKFSTGFYNLWILLLLWPLAITGFSALVLCANFTKTERDDSGYATAGGKHSFRSRAYLALNCGSSFLIIIIGNTLRAPHEYAFVFWNRFWPIFLLLMIGADFCAILSTLHGFKARGKGSWVLRTVTPIISIVSILATLVFPRGY